MFELIDILKQEGTIRFTQDFCNAIDMHKQQIVNIRAGKSRFTRDDIERAGITFGVDFNWIFGSADNWKRRKKPALSQTSKSTK